MPTTRHPNATGDTTMRMVMPRIRFTQIMLASNGKGGPKTALPALAYSATSFFQADVRLNSKPPVSSQVRPESFQ